MNKLKEIFSIDVRSLALFRIALASMILVNLATLAPDIEAFFSDRGIFPRSELVQIITLTPSIYFVTGTVLGVSILFLIQALFAVFLLIGWRTRWATFVSWFFAISLGVRNFYITNGGDYLMQLMLFWGMFLPLGAVFSVDQAKSPSTAGAPKRICSVATVALFVQFASLYIFGGLYKQAPAWKNGTALYYSLADEYFASSLGLFLTHFTTPLKMLSYLVRPFEIVGPLFLISPFHTAFFRFITIAAFFLFQAGMGASIKLMLFPYVSSMLLLPFIPSLFWDALARLFNRKRPEAALTQGGMRSFFPAQVLCLFFLIYIIVWQISEFKSRFELIPSYLQSLGPVLQISQIWSMYSVTPLNTGWFAVVGKLQDGSEVDLYRKGKPWREEKPAVSSEDHPGFRWRYLASEFAYKDNYKSYLFYYADWLCNKWNGKHQGASHLTELEVIDFRRPISPQDLKQSVSDNYEKVSLYKYNCPL